MTNTLAALTAVLFLGLAYAYTDYWGLPPGPYCKYRGCCNGRQDECSAPILGTLCYCDDFCNRTISDDCCPDYLPVCKGIEEIRRGCPFEGRYLAHGQTVKRNCNSCKCEVINGKEITMCEEDPCLVEDSIIKTVNQMSDSFGWLATNYSEFWGRKLEDGIIYKLGTLQPHKYVMNMSTVIRDYDPKALPRFFDADQEWPGFITPVQDQGWCGSSWAVSTAATASDRFAVISKGLERVTLSAQMLLSCNNRGQRSCNGGYLDRAWMYLRKFGVVDENCYPFVGHDEKCRIRKKGNLLSAGCAPPYNVDRKERYKVAPVYRLNNETDIMFEILKSGPVQATMRVFHDFFSYRSGIYRHTDLSVLDRTGYHSVRIVGWGEKPDYFGKMQKYWKVANSWGRDWGENGYFRIIKGSNECEIESFVLAAWPLTVDPVSKNDVYAI